MKSYDPDKDYLGPEGNRLSEYIPKYPLGMPNLKPYINKAAYNHDVGYEGVTFSSILSWSNPFAKIRALFKDRRTRGKIDKAFGDAIHAGILIEWDLGNLTEDQVKYAQFYAEACYTAVDTFGWAFYRQG